MNSDLSRLRVTMEQMERLIRALEDLKENVLPKDPSLFATMPEGPLDDLQRLRHEVRQHVDHLQPMAWAGDAKKKSHTTD